jgi:hypothetical protein
MTQAAPGRERENRLFQGFSSIRSASGRVSKPRHFDTGACAGVNHAAQKVQGSLELAHCTDTLTAQTR